MVWLGYNFWLRPPWFSTMQLFLPRLPWFSTIYCKNWKNASYCIINVWSKNAYVRCKAMVLRDFFNRCSIHGKQSEATLARRVLSRLHRLPFVWRRIRSKDPIELGPKVGPGSVLGLLTYLLRRKGGGCFGGGFGLFVAATRGVIAPNAHHENPGDASIIVYPVRSPIIVHVGSRPQWYGDIRTLTNL